MPTAEDNRKFVRELLNEREPEFAEILTYAVVAISQQTI